MLEMVLLGHLSLQPHSGYDLKQSIDSSTKYFWDSKQSQIYRTLKQMEAQELLTSSLHPQEERPDRRVYTITPAGRQRLAQWLNSPLTEVTYKKDPLLLKTFFGALGSKPQLLTQLRLQRDLMWQEHQTLHVDLHEHLERLKTLIPPDPTLENTLLLWEQVRRYGEQYFDHYIHWLDECITNIEENYKEN